MKVSFCLTVSEEFFENISHQDHEGTKITKREEGVFVRYLIVKIHA